jgi:hypothetical protein
MPKVGENIVNPKVEVAQTSYFKRVWSRVATLATTVTLLANINPSVPASTTPNTLNPNNIPATIEYTYPAEFYNSSVPEVPLEQLGGKTAILQIVGNGLEWENTDDELPQSEINGSIELLADGLDTTTEELNDDIQTLSPIDEPDSDFLYGEHLYFDKTDKAELIAKLILMRDKVLQNPEYGRVIILSTTHGGNGLHWFDETGIGYSEFTKYLVSFGNMPVKYIAEECYAGAALSPWSGFKNINGVPTEPFGNSFATSLLEGHPNLTYIAVAAPNQLAYQPTIRGTAQRNATIVLLEAFTKPGSIVESVGDISNKLLIFTDTVELDSSAGDQRITLRQSAMATDGPMISRLSQAAATDEYHGYGGYPTTRADLIGSDAMPLGLYVLEVGKTKIVNYSGIARKITDNNGEVYNLQPFETITVGDAITSIADDQGFKAYVPVEQKDNKIDECLVTGSEFARWWPDNISIVSERLQLPFANRCQFPITALINMPSKVYVNQVLYYELDLDNRLVTLPPLSVDWVNVTDVFGNKIQTVEKGETGIPIEIIDPNTERVLQQFLINGVPANTFQPFSIRLSLIRG